MNKKLNQAQRTYKDFTLETDLLTWVSAFLVDRKVQNLSKGTVEFYEKQLKYFINYCDAQVISNLNQVTPTTIRQFLLHLEESGHNPGGVHAAFRTVKCFLRWYDAEVELDDWVNPIKNIKAPKVPIELIDPVELVDVAAMVETCRKGKFTGDRDRAILLALLDTGARAQEFLDLDIRDVDLVTGEVIIRKGKGGKPRTVYFGSKSRKAARSYMKHRSDDDPAFWVRDDGEGRLTYDGLRAIIERRSKFAEIETPGLHDFRRAFAINMLRSGTDLVTLAKLMGHSTLVVLQRYLKQTNEDTKAAHRLASPVDTLL